MIHRKGLIAAALAGLIAAPAAWAADDTMVWGKPAEITGFDVHVVGTVASWEMFQMVYETLLTTDEDMTLRPGLAESWEQLSPTEYTLTLREGAAFSNGRAVTTEDVIGTFERITDPETASYWAAQLGEIESVEATGERQVTVTLAKPHTAFLPALAHISAAVIPVQEWKDGEFDPTSELLGSGPYMVVEHNQDESWTLKANPHYDGEALPKVETLEAPIIPDESARIAALRDGRIDFTTFENPDITMLMGGDENVEIDAIRTSNYYRVDVNALSEESAFHDERVRRAMSLAVDREAINQIVFGGTTQVDYPVPRAFATGACEDAPSYSGTREERLEQARALLEEAENPNPSVELMASSANPTLGRIAQVMQQSLQEAGFEVEIEQVPTAEYLQRVFTDGDFDFSLSWLAGYTDPSMVIAWWNPKFAVWNTVFHEYDEDLANALDEVKGAPAGEERNAQLTEICGMIDRQANILALTSKVDYLVSRTDKVKVMADEVSGSSNTYRHIAEFESLD
ncbi:MAG: ABC transporter substrate-binding protein [Pseudomonadota bacterium]